MWYETVNLPLHAHASITLHTDLWSSSASKSFTSFQHCIKRWSTHSTLARCDQASTSSKRSRHWLLSTMMPLASRGEARHRLALWCLAAKSASHEWCPPFLFSPVWVRVVWVHLVMPIRHVTNMGWGIMGVIDIIHPLGYISFRRVVLQLKFNIGLKRKQKKS